MNEDDLYERLILWAEEKGFIEPTTLEDIELFEKKLQITLPSLLKRYLLKTNGGEALFARCTTPFIPPNIATISNGALWLHLLQPWLELGDNDIRSLAMKQKDKFIPLGDDYSGEVIALEISKKTCRRVWTSSADTEKPFGLEICSEDFNDFVEGIIIELDTADAKSHSRKSNNLPLSEIGTRLLNQLHKVFSENTQTIGMAFDPILTTNSMASSPDIPSLNSV